MYSDFVCVVTLACIMTLYTCKAMTCYMGQQPNPKQGYELRWVLPYTKDVLCECTYILFGGLNLEAPVGAEDHFYPDNPMILINNDNLEELRGLLGCDGAEPTSRKGSNGDPTSVTSGEDDTTAVTTDSDEPTLRKGSSQASVTGKQVDTTAVTTDSEECFDPLGMEDRSIIPYNIQASSYHTTWLASRARLNGNRAWCAPSSYDAPWIQADIGHQTTVTGVVSQGQDSGGNNWVTTLKVSTFLSSTSDPETFIKDAAGEEYKVFNANTDSDTEVTIQFEPVTARIVRIYPLTKSKKYYCMRFELLGCKIV